MTNVSPVAGLSMIWVYGVGYVVAVVMGAFNVAKLWRLFTGQLTEAEMVAVIEAEGLKEAEELIHKVEVDNATGAKA